MAAKATDGAPSNCRCQIKKIMTIGIAIKVSVAIVVDTISRLPNSKSSASISLSRSKSAEVMVILADQSEIIKLINSIAIGIGSDRKACKTIGLESQVSDRQTATGLTRSFAPQKYRAEPYKYSSRGPPSVRH